VFSFLFSRHVILAFYCLLRITLYIFTFALLSGLPTLPVNIQVVEPVSVSVMELFVLLQKWHEITFPLRVVVVVVVTVDLIL
jgi:hypothetical protein